MYFWFLICLISLPLHAGLEKVTLKNVNLDYVAPSGRGEAEKISVATSLMSNVLPFEITRRENSFDVTTPFIDYSWLNPPEYFYTAEAFEVKGLNVSMGSGNHSMTASYVMIRPESKENFKGTSVEANCEGNSSGDFLPRLLEDCRKSMNLRIKKLDVPQSFIFHKLVEDIKATPEMDIPADNLIFTSKSGEFSLQVYLKYWVYAGLRSWGKISFEKDYKTVVIKIDQIKFGYLSVTDLVMKKLKESNKNPDVVVEPPFIRIDIGNLYESKQK